MSKRRRRNQDKQRRHGQSRSQGGRRIATGAGLALGASLVTGAGTAQALDFTVNNLDDPGNGICQQPYGCTLREAVEAADSNSGPDRVLFASGLSGTITIDSGSGSITINDGVQILGPGADQITVDGNDAFGLRLFTTAAGGEDVLLSGLTLTGGHGFFSNGGAISNGGDNLTIADSILTDNYADSGGAISSSGQLTITNSTLSVNEGYYRAGAISSAGTVTISNSTINDNYTHSDTLGPANGGAILNNGILTIANSTLSGNKADDDGADPGNGGAIFNSGDVSISNSTLSNNVAHINSGAIQVQTGSLQLESSTLSGNTADNAGGGIYFFDSLDSAQSIIRNSTISGNTVTTAGGSFDDGGAIYVSSSGSGQGPLLIENSTLANNNVPDRGGALWDDPSNGPVTTVGSSTIAGNTAGNDGGGIASFSGTTLQNTVVANNSAGDQGPDLWSQNPTDFFDTAFSLIENTSDAAINETVAGSNILGVDPQLGPLASNGGPTQTMALPQSSPAVDKGSSSLGSDQRGSPRPFDFVAVPNSAAAGANGADIGAYELAGSNPKCKGKAATIVASAGTTKGTDKRDVIVGTNGKNKINSRGGNDLVCAKGGKDTVNGGGGKDKLFGQGGKDKLSGKGGKDKLVGGAKKDKLIGGAGADKLLGKGGKDTCVGGPGKDTLKSC
jgi:CSLREA domain-containing protein